MNRLDSSLRLLTFVDAANLVGVSSRTVRRWVAAGLIPVTRLTGKPRIRESHLRKAIEHATTVETTEVRGTARLRLAR